MSDKTSTPKDFERDELDRCRIHGPDVRTIDALERALDRVQRAEASLTPNDKRWRILEHGCQWVSWTPIGGETVSFDPRDVKYLKAMRDSADKTLLEQVELLRAEAYALGRRRKK